MDKTSHNLSSHNHLTVVAPRLVRSRSGSNPTFDAITTTKRSSHSERFTITSVQRSKSTTRTRTTINNEVNNVNLNSSSTTSISSKSSNVRVQEKERNYDFGKFLRRAVNFNDNNNVEISKRTTSTTINSPSAWALSPGRWSLSSPIWPQPPTKANNSSGVSGGSVTKVFKYFKQKKVSSIQEEEYHKFRILYNRFLQWRFINARAEVAMANVKNIAEIQLFSVWVRMVMLRKITIQKRMELQRVKHVIKLYQILNGQLYLLTEWEKLERKNKESVAKLTRKLLALSTILPLTQVKVDTESVFEAMNRAIKAMESMKPLITKYQTKVEMILYQITELTTTLKHEEEYLQELLGLVQVIATLLENEKSIQVHLIQTTVKSNMGNYISSVSQ